ncbi:PepSY domain-containing protein [Streptomyces sp. NPDC054887]
MKRKLVIATAVAALLAGGTATAFATSDDDTDGTKRVASTVTLDEAASAATKASPGTVTGAELDDDAPVWEIDVFGKDAKWHDVDVDAGTAKVRSDRTEDDEDDRAPRTTEVTVQEAAAAALKARPGTLTSIDLDEDGGTQVWEAEVRSKDGKHHELAVDARTAEVTADRDDQDDRADADDRDDRDDRDDDNGKNDDRDDHNDSD